MKTFVAKKARLVITDVTKLDVVSDGLLHNQLLDFCHNARMAFLGRNTPTPLLSEFMAQVDDTIVKVVCRHGTGGGHVDWSPHLRKCANMMIQAPHFRGGFGITPKRAALFQPSALPPARLSSGWVAAGAPDLPKTSRIRGRPG